MKMKTMSSLALMFAAVALLFTSMPVHASKMDDGIVASVKASYVFKNYLKDDDIKVVSKDGVVTLTGTVAEESHKALAQETVMGLAGVKSVDNKLAIKGERHVAMSDGWITAKVKSTFLFRQNVSSLTEVTTKDGIVTLKGEATDQAQKDLTTEYARDVEGVKEVKNEMNLSKSPKKAGRTTGEKIDDASITAQVKMSLLLHRSTSALKTSVSTKNGVVMLSGKAANAAEKSMVTKLVNDVKGVKNVKNQMTIEK